MSKRVVDLHGLKSRAIWAQDPLEDKGQTADVRGPRGLLYRPGGRKVHAFQCLGLWICCLLSACEGRLYSAEQTILLDSCFAPRSGCSGEADWAPHLVYYFCR